MKKKRVKNYTENPWEFVECEDVTKLNFNPAEKGKAGEVLIKAEHRDAVLQYVSTYLRKMPEHAPNPTCWRVRCDELNTHMTRCLSLPVDYLWRALVLRWPDIEAHAVSLPEQNVREEDGTKVCRRWVVHTYELRGFMFDAGGWEDYEGWVKK